MIKPHKIVISGFARIQEVFWQERPQWFLWTPVLFGLGIAVYFAWPVEPPLWPIAAAFVLVFARLIRVWQRPVRYVLMAVLIVIAGFGVAKLRTWQVTAPVLEKEIKIRWIEGDVDSIQLLPKGAKLVLENLQIPRVDVVPKRVRVKVWSIPDDLVPGDRVKVLASLSPPSRPAYPGGYDFQRHMFFEQLGGLGYSLKAPEIIQKRQNGGWHMFWQEQRANIAKSIQSILPREQAGIAIALLVGEQTGIPKNVVDTLREVGLVHILSISGMHMTMIGGLLFFSIRLLLALVPGLALRYPIKKWAAGAAIVGTFVYMYLAGAPLPTQRSFLMIALVFLAIIVDRTAISQRTVAIAALFILILFPEALLSISFQLSFAAVIMLIAVFEYVDKRGWLKMGEKSWLQRVYVYLLGIIITTLAAQFATTAISLFYFSQFYVYGVLGNLLAVPLSAVWIMPFGLLSLIAWPLGLHGWPLLIMGQGIELMIVSARMIADFPGSSFMLPKYPQWLMYVIVLSGLWLCFWQQKWRWYGVPVLLLGHLLLLYPYAKPLALVNEEAKLWAIQDADGHMQLNTLRRDRFVSGQWLNLVGQSQKQGIREDFCDTDGCIFAAEKLAIVYTLEGLVEDCQPDWQLVDLTYAPRDLQCENTVVDAWRLRREGAAAIWAEGDGVRVETVNMRRGQRPWVY